MTAPVHLVRRKGQPAWVLLMILVGWIGLRFATWMPMAAPELHPARLAKPTRAIMGPAAARPVLAPYMPMDAPLRLLRPDFSATASAGIGSSEEPQAVMPGEVAVAPWRALSPGAPVQNPYLGVEVHSILHASPDAPPPVPLQVVSAHAMLWMAAITNVPLPPGMLATGQALPPARPDGVRRWSADGWLLLRQESSTSLSTGAPTYGASQLGAVIRYRLANGGMRPALYMRATAALGGTSGGSAERGLAAGMSVRPIAALPVRIMAEVRADRFAEGSMHARAAVFAVSEVAPVELPASTRAEFYAQGGYVTGPTATTFIDGQLRIDHRVMSVAGAELRAGAGAWGGAQRGAGRLDLGPSATIVGSHGAAAARLALDWRFRVAGNASPVSGPALTISAGF